VVRPVETRGTPSGDERELTYAIDGDADFEVSVGGVETEKLTVNA